jgi:hypothetical protein
MKSHLAVIAAAGLFLISTCVDAGRAAEIHAYALEFEVLPSAPPVDACPHDPGASAVGVIWVARNVVFLGPGVGTSGVDSGDVTTIVCNGDTPQQIREKLTAGIQHLAADRGYAVKPANIVMPKLQRGDE